ncbi:hypothetical protein I4U23_013070 [Adineta vaga]|nr:hypothetical protein I4U23_013070 [Adineta vaga]
MNVRKDIVSLLINIVVIMIRFDRLNGELNECFRQEYSPLCICHSTSSDLFLSILSLSQCNNSLSVHHCHQGHFHPPLFHLTQLIPQLANHSHCLQSLHCLHSLPMSQHCNQCYLTSSLLSSLNHSFRANYLSMNTCFYLCQYDTSCGFLCLNEHITESVICHQCQKPRHNIACYCIKTEPLSSCFSVAYKKTTEQWMEKHGLPAAGYLLLIILSIIPLVIVVKLVYYQCDRYQNGSIDHSIHVHSNRQLSYGSSTAV